MARRDHPDEVPGLLLKLGGAKKGVAREVAAETGVPEADVHGVATFFHLLADPDVELRVCQGLSCAMNGAAAVLEAAKAAGIHAAGAQCLAGCDRPVAALKGRRVVPDVTAENVAQLKGSISGLPATTSWQGHVGAYAGELAFDLEADPDFSGAATALAATMTVERILDEVEASGLQGRGGAGFPAHIKWRAVRGEKALTKYVVLNADEGEPGTFKDRELLVRRPDLVVEGLAIAARTVGAKDIYCYLRGEFEIPWQHLEDAIERLTAAGALDGLNFHLHAGHGAYICGEETALLEALEGKRGMPRLKPPFPTQHGLWGKPTLVHNVETIAALPALLKNGGAWFAKLGRTGPGTKLYCVSGDVAHPGVFEMPLGVSLDELVAAAGGYLGELKAFSPGGASSGFLPAQERGRALDFKSLGEVGSMLGSAGAVVLNTTRSIVEATENQLAFFEEESCGQCAPCRIGTRMQHEALTRHAGGEPWRGGPALRLVDDVAWEMEEGSICGLGQIASLPLTSALRWFPEEFS